jgi:hypothetical protein
MTRGLAALLAGLAGIIGGAGLVGVALAVLFTNIYGSFEGSAAIGGFTIGMPVGGIIGLALGLWLVLRKGAPSPGKALAWSAGVLFLVLLIGVLF